MLGPLLFLIYINDMPQLVQHVIKLFADETKLVATIRDIDELVQSDIEALATWTVDWRLLLHPDKCLILIFGKSKAVQALLTHVDQPLCFTIKSGDNTTTLSQSSVEKDLGVFITSDLKWDVHIRCSINKANRVLATLKRTFKLLFETFVRPHLEYAAPIWNPSRSHHIKTIEVVQRRATKLVKATRGMSYERRLTALGMVSLEHRRLRGDLIQAFKCMT